MWDSGRYVASRSIGFPLFELAATPLVSIGEWYLSNLLAMLGGLTVLWCLVSLGRAGRLRHPAAVVVVLGFIPVIVVNSSVTLDYIPGLAVMLWSYKLLLDGRWWLAFSLIGLAAGMRPTSILVAIPTAIYVFRATRSLRVSLQGCGLAGLVALAAYSPMLIFHGVRTSGVEFDARTHLLILGYRSLELFGAIQGPIMAVTLGIVLWRRRVEAWSDLRVGFHFTNIFVWMALFVRFPHEPEYLLPSVPSMVLMLDRFAGIRTFCGIAVILLSYHVVRLELLGGESGRRTLRPRVAAGFTFWDLDDRRFKLATRRAATTYRADRPTILMYGDEWIPSANPAWTYDDRWQMYRQVNGRLYVTPPILDETRLRALRSAGFRLVAWRGHTGAFIGHEEAVENVEMVDRLDDFLGQRLTGRPLQ
jgi:hypothetical protein